MSAGSHWRGSQRISLSKGEHEPIWTQEDFEEFQREMKRRRLRLEQERECLGSVLESIPDYLERAVNRSLRELFEAVYVNSQGKIVSLELN